MLRAVATFLVRRRVASGWVRAVTMAAVRMAGHDLGVDHLVGAA